MQTLRSIFRIKKILKSAWLQIFLQRVVYVLVRLLMSSYRLNIKHCPQLKQPLHEQEGIFYFWHQSIISGMFFFFKTKNTGACVVSPSRDGRLVGYACSKLGFSVIYGSAHKNPISLIRQATAALVHTPKLCLVGDGSRGPAFILQKGVSYLASKSGKPVIFVQCSPSRAITLKKTWDHFHIPLPFSTIEITLSLQEQQ